MPKLEIRPWERVVVPIYLAIGLAIGVWYWVHAPERIVAADGIGGRLLKLALWTLLWPVWIALGFVFGPDD